MIWVADGVGIVLLLAVLLTGVWLLVPTIRTFRGPSFEPAPKDDESVLLAQQPGVIDPGVH